MLVVCQKPSEMLLYSKGVNLLFKDLSEIRVQGSSIVWDMLNGKSKMQPRSLHFKLYGPSIKLQLPISD